MRISDWSSDVCSSDLRYFSAIGVRSWKLLEEWLGSEHGTASSPRASRRGLSSDGPRQRRPAGVPRRGGLPAVPRDSGRKLHALRLALLWLLPVAGPLRSEERRVGKEWVGTCRSRWSQDHEQKKHRV